MTHQRQLIFQEILDELNSADEKWGTEFDAKNTPNDWIAYLVEYTGAAIKHPWNHELFRRSLIKTAGLCVSAIMWCDNTGGDMPKRHYDGLPS